MQNLPTSLFDPNSGAEQISLEGNVDGGHFGQFAACCERYASLLASYILLFLIGFYNNKCPISGASSSRSPGESMLLRSLRRL